MNARIRFLVMSGAYPEYKPESWTPEVEFECGTRRWNGRRYDDCTGISRFTGEGICDMPTGNTTIYAQYRCPICFQEIGMPTSLRHRRRKCAALKWNGKKFIEAEENNREDQMHKS